MINNKELSEKLYKINFFKWVNHYKNPLIDLFEVFKQNEFKDYNDNEIIKDIQFLPFCNFVYNNSSKTLYNYEY